MIGGRGDLSSEEFRLSDQDEMPGLGKGDVYWIYWALSKVAFGGM